MAKSAEVNRVFVLDCLRRLKDQGTAIVQAETREEFRKRVVGDRMGNSTFIRTVESLHYKYHQVDLRRSGQADGGVSRGWIVSLSDPYGVGRPGRSRRRVPYFAK